ncbi:DNA alkylation repair protein [Subtercola boreus]|uniref:DNA alkylation repair protein n=1 Tax=Subtercola boreus TaxID=120213 RepID=A0A3E0W7I7_9MICO|nr:DNA alkylation repair protein [Subtercola boreus]RFA18849.1 DNA alkylation repair protein [Subtercola boreus]RFA18963.1 DNA alkylation repair protein [Subtercola boreus]RFA25501.1 DNA alkylation repair protein [Subtercola boreus]
MPSADELIGTHTANALVRAIHVAAPEKALTHLQQASTALAPLSLRERGDVLRDALLADLPGDYDSFAQTIRRAEAGVPLFSGWLIWPVTSAVAARAIAENTDEAFDDAMALLGELTSRLTSEFAIRGLLDHDLQRALGIIQNWTVSDDVDLRRLASEGTRAFLPWSNRVRGLLTHPRATLPIISALYRDPSEYVRRSVANHLNDLSRQHPEIVVETARQWMSQPDENTGRLVSHGLRTLVKRGDPGALSLLGFSPAESIAVDGPTLDQVAVSFGGTVRFTIGITNTGSVPARLAVDYIVHHRRANGTQTGKTFKLTTATLAPGERLDRTREHSFRAITTRRYYPGPHAIELQVNGIVLGRAVFELLPET